MQDAREQEEGYADTTLLPVARRADNGGCLPTLLTHSGHSVGSVAARRNRFELREHWWARTVSNRRPLVCKATGNSELLF